MKSPVVSPIPQPAEFQAHVYSSFLQGRTSDVAIRIRGSWDAVYKLHRVVLIQADYFRNLFTGGFVESEDKDSAPGSRVASGPLEVELYDTNITRAAFELCIARLYGGGPPLFVDPAIVPTPSCPLTPSFANSPHPTHVPPGHQPATPRFLLSLLAASTYLSIPSLTAEALSSVTSTVGPSTVMYYLRFACGEGIGPPQGEDQEPLIGLEHVAQLVKAEPASCILQSIGSSAQARDEDVEFFSQNLQALSVGDQIHGSHDGAIHDVGLSVEKEDPAELSSESGCPSSPLGETGSDLSFLYGAVSDKIGEACVCWLARWGADVLVYEQQAAALRKQPVPRATVSGWRTPSSDTIGPPPVPLPLIWRRGGLTTPWVHALLSSDLLFVKGERDRYDLAKAVVELRRNEGILEEEEAEWVKMFVEGIYYANMSFDDLVYISNDRSPTTGRLYVPERVIQAAHWAQSMLRHQVVGGPPLSPTASPAGANRHQELGISVTQKDIKEVLSHPEKDEENRMYWPIPNSSYIRIGECAGIENASMDELFGLGSGSSNRHAPGRSSMSVSSFFGLKTDLHPAVECASSGSSDATRWVPYPPYRFGVEYWDVDSLREKSHLYSQTIWYAGSLFNVFVQMFRKKTQGPQLGIYLHRQSSVDPIPPLSIPHGSTPAEKLAENRPRNPPNTPSPIISPTYPTQYSFSGIPMIPSPRSSTPVQGSPSNSSISGSSLPATGPPIIPSQPYRDSRAQVSAYFTISCASATGSSVTRFSSNPDDFSISQSWGWRSSSLRTEVCVDGDRIVDSATSSLLGDINSVRVTVVLGVV